MSSTSTSNGGKDSASNERGITDIGANAPSQKTNSNETSTMKTKANLIPILNVHFNATVLMLFTYVEPDTRVVLALDVNANTVNGDVAVRLQNSFAGNPLGVVNTKANTAASSIVSVVVSNKPTDLARYDTINKVCDEMNLLASDA